MRQQFLLFGLFHVAMLAGPASATADSLRLDSSMWLGRFQQQAKTKVGAPRGERLVENNSLSLSLTATYDLSRFVAVGAFLEFDIGTRRSGELQGFDSEGRATIEPALGGNFAEIWSGVLVRPQWRSLFVDIGYAALTRRWDDGRDDILGADGNQQAFDTTLSVRWIAALGGTIGIAPCLDLALRFEWRIRYYDTRGGQPLMNNIIHGTQEIRPLVGLAWRPDWF